MILVTGGTGFLGREVVRKLLERGHRIRLLSRDAKRASSLFPEAEVTEGDITNIWSLEGATKGVNTVIHLAGKVSYSDISVYMTNAEGTRNLIMQCGKVKKIIFSSSVAVYGKIERTISEATPCRPKNDYGKSKLEAEEIIRYSGIPYVILRIAPIYGYGSYWWNRIMEHIMNGGRIPKTDNMTQIVHVSDAAESVILALEKNVKGTYIIADSRRVKLSDITNILSEEFGVSIKTMPLWAARLFARIKGASDLLETLTGNRSYDITKAVKELGFRPMADMESELIKMARRHAESLK